MGILEKLFDYFNLGNVYQYTKKKDSVTNKITNFIKEEMKK